MKSKKIKKFKFNKAINLYCFTDVHMGAKDHDSKKFKKAIDILKKDKDGYCFFNGDTLEFTPGGHHGATNEQNMSNTDQLKAFTNMIKDLGKKVLFFRTGNHEARAAELCDVKVYEVLSNVLKVPELHRGMEEVHVNIKNKTLRLATTHGEGGGSKRALMQLQLAFPGADLFFTGHTHELYCNEGNINIDTSTGFEVFKRQIEICGGSFLGWADYARSKNMRPTETGCFVLRLDENGVFVKGKIV